MSKKDRKAAFEKAHSAKVRMKVDAKPTPKDRAPARMRSDGQTRASFWQYRIRRAMDAREREEGDWTENRELANAADYIDGPVDHDRVWPNIILSTLRYMVPEIIQGAPLVAAKPAKPESERTYQMAELNANRCFRLTKFEEESREAIQDALLTPFGYVGFGWIRENVDVTYSVDKEGNEKYIDNSDDEPSSMLRIEQRTIGIGSRPFCHRISPWNFVRSRGSTKLENASWCAERMFFRMGDLKRDKTLKPDVLARVRPNATQPASNGYIYGPGAGTVTSRGGKGQIPAGQALADPDDELVEIWQIWDREDRTDKRMMIVVMDVDDFLKDVPWPYHLRGRFPVEELNFIKLSDKEYPIPYVSSFKQMVKSKALIETYKLAHVLCSTPRIGYNTQMVDQPTAQKYTDGEPVPLIGVDGNPQNAFQVYNAPQMSADLPYIDRSTQQNIDTQSGLPQLMMGGSSPGRELATQTDAKVQGTSLLVQDMERQFEKFVVRCAELFTMLSAENMTSQEAIRVGGPEGFQWKKFSKIDITGDYEYELIPGSLKPVNRDMQLQAFNNLINVLAPLIAPGSVQINGAELIRPYLVAADIPNIDKILGQNGDVPPSDPAEENFFMSTAPGCGGQPPVSPKENFQQHLQYHMARLQQLLGKPDGDVREIARLQQHIKETLETAQRSQIQEQMKNSQLQQMAQQAVNGPPPGGPGAPPPGPGGPGNQPIQRGPGQGGPAKVGPVRPRMLAESQPSKPQMLGAARRGPQRPGGGPQGV